MTEAAAENVGELDEIQARVVEMDTMLKQRAPQAGPSVVPRVFQQALIGVQLFLASNAGKLPATAAGEEVEGGKEQPDGDGDRHHVVLTTETDIATRTFRINAAKFGGKVDAVLSNLELLMELHLNATEDEMEPYVSRFASENDFDPSSGRTAASALQEVVSLAYALQVAASNMAGWTGFVGSFQLPLADGVDMGAVAKELFEPPPPPASTPATKAASGGKKGGKRSKSKPSKKKKGASPAAAGAARAAAGAGAGVGVAEGRGSGGKEKGGKEKARGSKRKK